MSKEVEFIGTTELRSGHQRRRSERLSSKGKGEKTSLKPCIARKSKRKTRRTMSESSTGASSHETRSATKKRKVSVASRTTNRRSRFSSATPTSSIKKETQKSKEFSELKRKSFVSDSFVVTPCQPKRNLSPSLNSSSSLSPDSHPSINSFTSKEELPRNVCDIDEYFSKVDHTYNNHNSCIVLNHTFMRDYGKEHFYYSSLREQKETSVPSKKDIVHNSSIRITRSKRTILDGLFNSSDSSTTSSISCYESFTSSNKASRRVKKKTSIQDPYFDYMKNQPCLAPAMRTLLIDWFVELSEEYKLKPETLHLSVRILDRVLAKSEKKSLKEEKGLEPKKKKAHIKKSHFTSDSSPSLQSDSSNDSGSTNSDPILLISSEEEDESDEENDRKKYKGFVVRRQMLQCVGCASMLIAAKLEEVKAPSPSDFSYISDSTYTPKQIRRMEMKICTHLQFQMRQITPMAFFQRFVRASLEGDSNPRNFRFEHLCHYLLELSLLEYELVGTKSSLVMASVIYLARATLGIRSNVTQDGPASIKSSSSYRSSSTHQVCEYWSPTLEYYTGYEIWGMKDVIHVLHKLQSNAGDREDKLKSVFQKYKSVKHMRVALKTSLRREELGI